MKKRFLPLILAFVVLIGGIGVRPQKAYANAVLAGEAVDVFYGLLGSMGVVVGFEKTYAQKQEEVVQFFEGLGAAEKSAFWEWYQSGTWATADTGHRVFNPSMELDTSWYRSFWQSAVDYCSTFVSYAPPLDGYTAYTLTSTVGGVGSYENRNPLCKFGDFPFVISTDVDSSGNKRATVDAVVSDTCLLRYQTMNGVVINSHFKYLSDIGNDDVFYYLEWCKWGQSTGGYLGITFGSSDTTSGYSASHGFYSDVKDYGIAWGFGDERYYLGQPDLSALAFYNGVAVSDELVPCDSWVKQWDDAKAENKQVGIIAGKDLTGYDTVSDVYAPDTGLVTGLETPTVDVPVTGDLTGIAGGIKSILDWLKGLIKALGDLLTSLFVPTDAALKGAFEPIMVGLKDKMDLETFENFKNQMQSLSSPPAPNITLDLHGTTYTVIDFTSFNSVRDKLFGWIRGYLFVFILLFNMNFVYKLIRGQSMFDGMGTSLIFGFGSDGNSGGSGKRGRDK